MTFASIIIQLLNGLAAASSLFLVSAGLSLIFGVTRIVNFAHGSLYMLGLYGAYTLIEALGRTPLGFWSAVVLAALAVGLVGVLIEVLVLRRIYKAPELFQLLATFAVVLIIKDIALWTWGAEDLVFPVSQAHAIGLPAPRVSVEVVAETGHVPHLERPDAVVALIEAFLGERP